MGQMRRLLAGVARLALYMLKIDPKSIVWAYNCWDM